MVDRMVKEDTHEIMLVKDIRHEVLWFARQMEIKLKENDHKSDYRNESLQYLSMRLTQERKELTEALKSRDQIKIIRECADIANFAMMIADQFKNDRY